MDRRGWLSRLAGVYNEIEEKLLVGSLVLNVLLVFTQVVMRTVFRNSLTWSEEFSRYIYIWEIWIGTSIALREGQHIRVTMLLKLFRSERVKSAFLLLADLIWFVFNVYMIFNGAELLRSMAGRRAVSSGMHLPMTYIFVAFPIASALMSLRMLGVLRGDLLAVISGTAAGSEAQS